MTFENKTPDVRVVPIAKGTGWKLKQDYFYHWEFDGSWYRFMIPAGFQFDGASVPRFLRWVAGGGRFGVLAPLVHDWLHHCKGKASVRKYYTWVRRWDYYPLQKPFTREQADKLFFRIMREKGIKPRWLRRWAYKLVRLNSRLKGDRWR